MLEMLLMPQFSSPLECAMQLLHSHLLGIIKESICCEPRCAEAQGDLEIDDEIALTRLFYREEQNA